MANYLPITARQLDPSPSAGQPTSVTYSPAPPQPMCTPPPLPRLRTTANWNCPKLDVNSWVTGRPALELSKESTCKYMAKRKVRFMELGAWVKERMGENYGSSTFMEVSEGVQLRVWMSDELTNEELKEGAVPNLLGVWQRVWPDRSKKKKRFFSSFDGMAEKQAFIRVDGVFLTRAVKLC